VYPELTQVPLVVSGPDCEGRCSKTTSLLDVHRTVLELADVGGSSRGQHLLEEIADKPRLVEYEGLRAARIRMMRDAGYADSLIETYDTPVAGIALSDAYYGYETKTGWNETGAPPATGSRELLRELQQTLDTRTVSGEDVEISDAVQERLQDLGYA
jgi:arylsulfatase A-like enzyme